MALSGFHRVVIGFNPREQENKLGKKCARTGAKMESSVRFVKGKGGGPENFIANTEGFI
jgi:hypothetical protein